MTSATPAPDITCVIPTFNDRGQLAGAVRSVLAQEGVQVEVLLVDDCSDEPARAAVQALADTDGRIRPFFLQRNGGQGQARNVGAALARGRHLTFLDQDDEHAPGWYRYALGFHRAMPTLNALSGEASIVDLPARLQGAAGDVRIAGLKYVFVTNMVFRTSAFRASGGFPTDALWRGRGAGEDGIFRSGFVRHWFSRQCEHPALIHRAREGGTTVFFLDRSAVEDGKTVIKHYEEIETNGVLAAAQEAFWDRIARTADEVRACGLLDS